MRERMVVIMCEKKELMYDCISWINRNYKKFGCNTFEKIFGFWSRSLHHNFWEPGKEMDSSKGHETGKVAIVNIYELSEEWDNFKVLSFEKENEPELFE